MTVGVALTTYNRAAVVGETIAAILEQTYSDFELVVSDDCSTDDTAKVVKDFARRDERVRYRCNDTRLGMPGNLNAALRALSHDYVANLHDGDGYSPHLLERWVAALDACPEAAFVFNAYSSMPDEGGNRRLYVEDLPNCFHGHLLLERIFFKRWHFDSPVWGTVMARRDAYEEAGYFDARFGFWSDVDMWLRLAETSHVAYVDEPLIFFPTRDDLPRLIDVRPAAERKILRRMFWEARVRHFRERQGRRAVELLRHAGHATASGLWSKALAVRARLRAI